MGLFVFFVGFDMWEIFNRDEFMGVLNIGLFLIKMYEMWRYGFRNNYRINKWESMGEWV